MSRFALSALLIASFFVLTPAMAAEELPIDKLEVQAEDTAQWGLHGFWFRFAVDDERQEDDPRQCHR
jgi:hypothetical protein